MIGTLSCYGSGCSHDSSLTELVGVSVFQETQSTVLPYKPFANLLYFIVSVAFITVLFFHTLFAIGPKRQIARWLGISLEALSTFTNFLLAEKT